jgi:proteasome lid subunit RPN8/RPN11
VILILAPELLAMVRDAALASYGEECCGLLLGCLGGDTATVTAVMAAENVAPEKTRNFEIDPAVLFAAHKSAIPTPTAWPAPQKPMARVPLKTIISG